ncbi:MAG: helix-turn-helix domain-containing protein [Firmicutes bacterium]|nr:helix-turn-helix domain-containing protein [Bacillota bacterium]
MFEKLLTPEEAAERMVVSPKTVRDWLRQGKLKGIKTGKLWRIRENDLAEFVARNTSGAVRSDGLENAVENAGSTIAVRETALRKYSDDSNRENLSDERRYTQPSEEDSEWLEASIEGPLPPYDWGPGGLPKARPVHYVPGRGLVIKGDEESGR